VILILPVLGEDPSATFNTLPEIEFSPLSQCDPNPLGEKALAQKFKIALRKRIDFEFAFANAGSAVMPPVRSAVGARLSNAPPMCLRWLALAK
jgi:hypothetical protein